MKTSKHHFYIVIPSYNQGRFIGQTIDSILRQKGMNVHVLVMDGGSSDDTVNVLKSYGKKIRWVSKKDAGQTDAINKGLKNFLPSIQDTDIVAYINSDDYYMSHAFEIVLQALKVEPTKGWIVGDALIVDEHNNTIQEPVRQYKKVLRMLFSNSLLRILNPIPQPAVFLKGKVIKEIGFFNVKLRYTMDYEYWLRIMKTFGAPLFVGTPLAAFRIHGQSKGTTAFIAQFAEEYRVAVEQGANAAQRFIHSLHIHCILFVYSLIKRA